MVTVWLHEAVFPQTSTALKVPVMLCGQVPFVTLVAGVTLTFWSQQVVLATGASKAHALPHWTVLVGLQTSVRLEVGEFTWNGSTQPLLAPEQPHTVTVM